MADQTIREALYELLSDPMDLPSVFWDYAIQSWLKDAPVFPISQVFGFAQFNAVTDVYSGSGGVVSTTYVTLTSPALSNLPDGKYLLLYGLQSILAGDLALMAPSINGAAASDNDALVDSGSNDTTMWAVLKTLSNSGSNSIVMHGRTQVGTSVTFGRRFLTALKYANL